MKLSRRVERLKPSPTLALNQKAKELEAQGRKIINLTLGEPDFITPKRIRDAAAMAMEKGATKYTIASGIPELKDAIIDKIRRDTGRTYQRPEVVVSVGAKQAFFNLCLALLEEGDEAILFAPYWVSYSDMIEFAGAKAIVLPTKEKDGFIPNVSSLEKAITSKTRLLILNSPSNPTGALYDRETIEKIAALISKHPSIMVATDDIYENLIYDRRTFFSISQVKSFPSEQLLIVNGVSKSYAMTGWRIGYALGPSKLVTAMASIQSQSTSNPTSISQWAALEAIRGPQTDVEEMRVTYEARRDLLLRKIMEIPDVTCAKPGGAFYLFPNFEKYLGKKVSTDFDLASYLLEKHDLALVPGSDFGAPGHLRITYSASLEELEEGAKRLAAGLKAIA